MNYRRTTLALLFVMGFASCFSALYVPTQKDAVTQNTTLEKLKQGRELLINKCTSCHNLHLPSQFTGKAWVPLLDKMQKRAHIDDVQKVLIMTYMETNCKKESPDK